mgnify:CR=1 FL=1
MANSYADTIVVLDFETTGLSPQQGDRAIEIGAVKLKDGVVIDSFQELMNPGKPVNSFIESYTGITNSMLSTARSNAEVMRDFKEFIGDNHMLAHNASFDKKFLDAEFARLNISYQGDVLCSLLTSRRLYQMAPNHRLGTLVEYKKLSGAGDFHRALFDAEMTAKLWLAMLEDITAMYNFAPIPMKVMKDLAKVTKRNVNMFLREFREN